MIFSGEVTLDPMERIEIPGGASYSPVALTDVIVGAPLATRVLLGALGPGQVLSTAAMGLYMGSAAIDWVARLGVRPIDFQAEYGADVKTLEEMPDDAREWEIRLLAKAMNEDYTDRTLPRADLARLVNQRLTDFIAAITEQQIITSSEVRSFTLAKLMFPFAQGTCDMVSGDVAIFSDTGIFEPHVIAHEFCHRKGYFKELHAQALSYLAMRHSGHPILVQGARAERLHRQLAVVSDGNVERYQSLLKTACLRDELYRPFSSLRPPDEEPSAISKGMRSFYDMRMRMMGQNGLSDYDRGFTNFLWTFHKSEAAKQSREQAVI